jgi:hypothetical protein
MPRLFEVHDRFPEEKLAIVGVHVGIEGGDEVDSAAKLDAVLTETREDYWHGRDLPFPVALVNAEKSRHAGAGTDARSAAAADYGVRYYPTTILIDPNGRVVGDADHLIDSEDDFAELRRLLDNAPSRTKTPRALTKPVLPAR